MNLQETAGRLTAAYASTNVSPTVETVADELMSVIGRAQYLIETLGSFAGPLAEFPQAAQTVARELNDSGHYLARKSVEDMKKAAGHAVTAQKVFNSGSLEEIRTTLDRVVLATSGVALARRHQAFSRRSAGAFLTAAGVPNNLGA